MGLNVLSGYYVNKRNKLIVSHFEPLPDIILDNISTIPEYIPDFLIILCFIYFFIFNYHFLNRAIIIHTCSMTMRSLCIIVTSYPSPKLGENLYHPKYDLMFSGHTTTYFCLAFDIIGYSLGILGSITMLYTHNHYTSDILIAVFITELLKGNMYLNIYF